MPEDKKFPTIHLNTTKGREETAKKLQELSKDLDGCRLSDLAWFAVEEMLKNPPTKAPAGSRSSTGTSPGFWIEPIMNPDPEIKGAVGSRVVEVAKRGDHSGRTFIRTIKTPDGDAAAAKEARLRALNQAKRAAQYDLEMCGLEDTKPEVIELATKASTGAKPAGK